MVIFHSYVSLPEGNVNSKNTNRRMQVWGGSRYPLQAYQWYPIMIIWVVKVKRNHWNLGYPYFQTNQMFSSVFMVYHHAHPCLPFVSPHHPFAPQRTHANLVRVSETVLDWMLWGCLGAEIAWCSVQKLKVHRYGRNPATLDSWKHSKIMA